MRRLLLTLLLIASTASAVTVKFYWPSAEGVGAVRIAGTSALGMRCMRWTAPFSGNIRKFGLTVASTTGGAKCGLGLYADTDALLSSIALFSQFACATTGQFSLDWGVDIAITEGTTYRLCLCSSTTAVLVQGVSPSGQASARSWDILNAGSIKYGAAAFNCAANADPPSSTGALTATTGDADSLAGVPIVDIQ